MSLTSAWCQPGDSQPGAAKIPAELSWLFPSLELSVVRVRPSTARRGGFIVAVINCMSLIRGESERLPALGMFLRDLLEDSHGVWWLWLLCFLS